MLSHEFRCHGVGRSSRLPARIRCLESSVSNGAGDCKTNHPRPWNSTSGRRGRRPHSGCPFPACLRNTSFECAGIHRIGHAVARVERVSVCRILRRMARLRYRPKDRGWVSRSRKENSESARELALTSTTAQIRPRLLKCKRREYAYSAYGEVAVLGPDGGNALRYTGRCPVRLSGERL